MKGIQQLMKVIFARTAIFQVGTAIRATTAGRMPAKTLATQGTSWKLWKNIAISNIIRNDGKAVPRAQQRAPAVLRFLYPMNVEILIAKTPGHDCAIAIRSRNSVLPIHLRLFTISASISGIMAYPPPIVKSPMRKNVAKSTAIEEAGFTVTPSGEDDETDMLFSCSISDVHFLFIFHFPNRECFNQPLIFLIGYPHEGTVLRSGYTYYIFRVGEITHVFISLADAVVARTG